MFTKQFILELSAKCRFEAILYGCFEFRMRNASAQCIKQIGMSDADVVNSNRPAKEFRQE